ncbi:hypothetical protein PHISP_05209 [Aspergillus sp. HF37]|nr:hypothetical protein PHISP_05209 [Aspergillus sp. HF37]
MPPPPSRPIRPVTGSTAHSTQQTAETQRPSQSIDFDSLFVPADDDRQWDVPNDEYETMAEDTLGWDATGEQLKAASAPRLRDDERSSVSHRDNQAEETPDDMGIPPTQRISQLHGLGLFD